MTISAWLRFHALKARNFLYFEIHPGHRWNFLGNHIRNIFFRKRHQLSCKSLVLKRSFVISLSSRDDRRQEILRQFKAQDFNFEFWDGVCFTSKKEAIPYFSSGSMQRLSHGALGCAASHISLWQKIATMESGLYLVFEDDVILGGDFIPCLENLQKHFPIDADIFYLGSRNNRPRDIIYFTEFGYAKAYNPRMGAFAYCLTPEAALKILELILPVDLLCGGIDTALGILTRKGKLIAYQFDVPQVFHNSVSSSSIYNPSVSKKQLHDSAISQWPWR